MCRHKSVAVYKLLCRNASFAGNFFEQKLHKFYSIIKSHFAKIIKSFIGMEFSHRNEGMMGGLCWNFITLKDFKKITPIMELSFKTSSVFYCFSIIVYETCLKLSNYFASSIITKIYWNYRSFRFSLMAWKKVLTWVIYCRKCLSQFLIIRKFMLRFCWNWLNQNDSWGNKKSR